MFTSFVKGITNAQSDLFKSFAIFYLLIVGAYIGDGIFTCYQRKFITQHPNVQLGIAFVSFYFLVILVSDSGNLQLTPPIERIFYALVYFVGFLIVMRVDPTISVAVLGVIFLIYFIEQNKEYYLEKGKQLDDREDRETYLEKQYWITLDWPVKIRLFKVQQTDFDNVNIVEQIMYYVAILLLVVGFVAYAGEVKHTLRTNKDLSWLQVVLDTNICKLKKSQGLWDNFLTGLNLEEKSIMKMFRNRK